MGYFMVKNGFVEEATFKSNKKDGISLSVVKKLQKQICTYTRTFQRK